MQFAPTNRNLPLRIAIRPYESQFAPTNRNSPLRIAIRPYESQFAPTCGDNNILTMKPQSPRRNSLRLQGFDYSTAGAYFVTICCEDRQSFFGHIRNGFLCLSELGQIATEAWLQTQEMWAQTYVDTWVLMPNHFHALLWFMDDPQKGLPHLAPKPYLPQTVGYENKMRSPSANLSSLIRGFKGAVTREARKGGYSEFGWQRSFHDRIVRTPEELNRIRAYILANPSRWREDEWFVP